MRTSIKLLPLLILSLGACAPEPEQAHFYQTGNEAPPSHINPEWLAPPPAGADAALGIILDTYDYHGMLPSISWYDGSRLNCPGHPDSWLAAEGSELCADGQLYSDTSELAISNWGGGYPIHVLALSHELCHWWALKAFGNGDAGHTGTCKPEGSGGMIDLANDALIVAGY